MKYSMRRRDALRNMAAASAGVFLVPAQALAQEKPLEIAGKPVELALAAVTPQTVRITIQPAGKSGALSIDGALVKENFGQLVATVKSLGATRTVKCGRLAV